MIYAKNAKPGTYCGSFHDIDPKQTFSVEDFLKKHSLPGPDSIVNCVLMPQGPFGTRELRIFNKSSSICQIPGLRYKDEEVASIPRPESWIGQDFRDSILRSIDC